MTILLILLIPLAAQAAYIDPAFKFKTLRTEHFDIHYHQGLGPFAEKAASYAEEAYCTLGETFGWRPRERTHMVLVDSSDLANGFTNVLPYNMVFIYMVPPLADTTIGEYDDWLRMVITHEYAHVATMDAVRGYAGVLRKIFGKPLPAGDILSAVVFFLASPPNVFMPDWWLEGSATWAETAYTTRGRGRSAFYEMIFRKAAEENDFLHISQMNGDIPFWPAGSSPYIYGLAMQRHITRHYGPEVLKELSMGHAGRFPYAINAVPKRATGKNYVQLYREMVDEIYREQWDKLNTIRSIPLTEFETLDIKGERLYYPRLSPDGRYLALQRHDPHGHAGIVILDADTLEQKDFIRRLPSDMSITWGPDSNTLCYTQAEFVGWNLYQDLYCYDVEDEDEDRITKGARLKDPDISPDGTSTAAVQVSAQGQSLVTVSLSQKQPKAVILKEFSGMRISSPRWAPDGSRIAYSVRDSAGNTGLRIYNTRVGADEGVYLSAKGADFPSWSPDGTHLIFTSYQTGVFNIFALRLEDHQLFQITNLTGGAFHPEVTTDGAILFSSYHAKGFDIARMDYRPTDWSTAIGPAIEPYWPEASEMPFAGSCEEGQEPSSEDIQGEDQGNNPAGPYKYNAFRSVWPRFWVPTIRMDHHGLVPGAFTAGTDVLSYHTFWADVGVGNSGQGYYDIAYIYNRWYPIFRLGAFAQPILYEDIAEDIPGEEDEDIWQKRSGAIASVTLPLQKVELAAALELGYIHRKDHTLDGPEGIVFEGRADSPFAALAFTNALRYPYSVSREEGRTLRLEYRDFNTERNADFTASQYWLSYEEYIGLPGHHVLYYKIKGAAHKGDETYVPYFLFGGPPGGNPEFPLRGYPSGYRTGDYAATVSLEHRFPVWYLMKGPNTKPLFFDRMHVAGFIDAGTTWYEEEEPKNKDIDVGVGAELRMDMVLGYKFKLTPALGVAFGLDEETGETQVYFTVYAPF